MIELYTLLYTDTQHRHNVHFSTYIAQRWGSVYSSVAQQHNLGTQYNSISVLNKYCIVECRVELKKDSVYSSRQPSMYSLVHWVCVLVYTSWAMKLLLSWALHWPSYTLSIDYGVDCTLTRFQPAFAKIQTSTGVNLFARLEALRLYSSEHSQMMPESPLHLKT